MKMLFIPVTSMCLAAGFIQMAVGLKCRSGCAACWLDNNANGVDIKILCSVDTYQCSNNCPTGYSRMHCAKSQRCRCQPGNGVPCTELGPCMCGIDGASGDDQSCKSADGNGVCQTS